MDPSTQHLSRPSPRRRPRTGFALAVAFAALLVAVPSAAAANATGINVTLPAGYTITGTVKSAANNPVANVSVFASGTAGYGFASTNASGVYTITALKAGSYKISFSAASNVNLVDGYYTTANANHFTTASASATAVVVGPNKTGIDTKMAIGWTISGKVTNTGGTPLEGVSVGVIGPSYNSAETDASGNYKIVGLAAGSYTMAVSADDSLNYLGQGYYTTGNANHFSTAYSNASALVVGPSKTAINVKVPTGLTLSGTIANSSGTPLMNASVSATSSLGFNPSSVSTDAAGHYTITGLVAGTYTISIGAPYDSVYEDGYYTTANANHFTIASASATGVTVTANKTGVNSRIATGYSISGIIKNTAGTGLSGAYVYGTTASDSDSAVTDALGNYTLKGLDPGAYTLRVSAPYAMNLQSGYFTLATASHFVVAAASAQTVTVGPSKTAINVRLPAGYTISGKITKTGGVALQYASVSASTTAGYYGYASTAADGTYTILGLAPGTYKVAVGQYGQNLQSGFYASTVATTHFTPSATSATGVTVGP